MWMYMLEGSMDAEVERVGSGEATGPAIVAA
jgi:hypothetical protein